MVRKNACMLKIMYAACCFTIPIRAMEQKEWLSLGSYAKGIALSYIGYLTLDYAAALCHEYGHALVLKALTGDTINIEILPSLNGAFGLTKTSSDLRTLTRTKRIMFFAAGPVVGIISTLLFYRLINFFDDNNDPTPIHFIKRVMTEMKNGTPCSSKIKGMARLCIDMIKVMGFGRIIMESTYGFVPIGTVHSESNPSNTPLGDGQRIWAELLNRNEQNYPCISRKLLYLGALVPAFLGLGTIWYNRDNLIAQKL